MISRGENIGTKIVDGVIIFVLMIITFLSVFPIIHTISISLSDSASVSAGKVNLLPKNITTINYSKLMEEKQFFVSFGVSIMRVILGGSIQFCTTILMAFPLSRSSTQFKGRNIYMWLVVFTMLFSGGLIPLFITVQTIGLMDSIWSLVLPVAVPVFNVILLMNFFRNLPKELEEAAIMDGAGPWYTMVKIYVPLALPAIATVTLFSIVGHWNAFFDGLIFINSPSKMPLQTYINSFMIQPSQMDNVDPETLQELMKVSDLGLNSAKVMVSMIPILLIYPFLQRYFIHGIVLGAVKE